MYFIGKADWPPRIACFNEGRATTRIAESEIKLPMDFIGKADWPPRIACSNEGRATARIAGSEIKLPMYFIGKADRPPRIARPVGGPPPKGWRIARETY